MTEQTFEGVGLSSVLLLHVRGQGQWVSEGYLTSEAGEGRFSLVAVYQLMFSQSKFITGYESAVTTLQTTVEHEDGCWQIEIVISHVKLGMNFNVFFV